MFRVEQFIYFIAAAFAVATLISLMTLYFYAAPIELFSAGSIFLGIILAVFIIVGCLKRQWVDRSDSSDHTAS